MPSAESPQRALSRWDTPPEVAAFMAGIAAELRPMERAVVLEPSCGSGNIVHALLDLGCRTVVAMDVDTSRFVEPRLRENVRVSLYECSVFDVPEGVYDACVMNPPFERGLAAKHIAHALTLSDVVVALAPTSLLHGQRNFDVLWKPYMHRLREVITLVRRPKFAGDGGKLDCSVYVFERASPFELGRSRASMRWQWLMEGCDGY